jgi:hypothetical protein
MNRGSDVKQTIPYLLADNGFDVTAKEISPVALTEKI